MKKQIKTFTQYFEDKLFESTDDKISDMKLRNFIRKLLRESLFINNIEFHLSVEPSLKQNTTFSNQLRTTSLDNTRGNMGTEESNAIFTTNSPEQWYQQFEMELADEPSAIPNNLYLVSVKKPSDYGYLNQSVNRPQDVVILQKVPNKSDGTPDFALGYKLQKELQNKTIK